MRRKRGWVAAVLAGGILLAFSLSINTARRGRLIDKTGRQVANAFVVYHYSAGVKLMWPFAHYDGPYLTRTDQDGRFTIPLKVHLRFPIVTLPMPVRAKVGVYAPEMHNCCDLSFDPAETDSYCFKSASMAGERVFTLVDLREDAIARFRTLWSLIYGPRAIAQGPSEQRRELVAAARHEYEEFLSEYGDVVFEKPAEGWPMAPPKDWTRESLEHRPWRFFLQEVPFYGITMEKRLAEIERQAM